MVGGKDVSAPKTYFLVITMRCVHGTGGYCIAHRSGSSVDMLKVRTLKTGHFTAVWQLSFPLPIWRTLPACGRTASPSFQSDRNHKARRTEAHTSRASSLQTRPE